MYTPIIVRRDRTTIITVALGIDVSNDVLSSEIRTEEDTNSDLLATWQVDFATDGVDGELVLTIQNEEVGSIEHTNGFMDMKRIVNGEPLNVFDEPLPVIFKGVVTA